MRARRTVLAAAVAPLTVVGCVGDDDAAPDESYVITGGGTTGVYYNYAKSLAAAMSDQLDLAVTVLESNGSVENLWRLASGGALLGFSQGDTAVDAVAGREPFDEPVPIEAVARVYDEFVHVVVPADSDIDELEDLRGRRVSLGAHASGTEIIAERLLTAAQVSVGELDNAELGIDGSIDALRDREIEAFVWVGGLHTPGVSDLADDMPIRLVPVDAQVDKVNAEHDGVYRHAMVPKGVYQLTQSVATMAVPNYLVTLADAPDDLVYDTVRVLFGERLSIAQQVPSAALLDRRQAIFTEPMDLHEGATRYYRETKP